MLTTRDGLPVERAFEKLLADHLVAEDRRLVKGQRYNLPSEARLVTATSTDCGAPAPLLHILSETAAEASIEP